MRMASTIMRYFKTMEWKQNNKLKFFTCKRNEDQKKMRYFLYSPKNNAFSTIKSTQKSSL
jgi:hypothetical protein